MLFKADDRGTGEDWAEVIVSQLCSQLGLPHVEYHLAIEVEGDKALRPGVICANMSPPPRTLILGNQLLFAIDSSYPSNQRFKVKQHTVEAVRDVVLTLAPPEEQWMRSAPSEVTEAIDVFLGYLMLDAWVGNQDRHHENWGAIWSEEDGGLMSLAPTFDHGSSLGRNLLDSEREDRLTTRDQGRSISAFASRGLSKMFNTTVDPKPLLLLDAFMRFAESNPKATSIWMEQLRAVGEGQIAAIIDAVPDDRMSEITRKFTLQFLMTNRQRLIDRVVQ